MCKTRHETHFPAIAKRVGTKSEPPFADFVSFLPNKTALCKSTKHHQYQYRRLLLFG